MLSSSQNGPCEPGGFAAVMAHFPRQLQHFASFGKSRYEWTRRSGAPSDHPFATGFRTVVYDPFVGNSVFVT